MNSEKESHEHENLFITDMENEIKKFISINALLTEKIQALNHIGYIAYIGEHILGLWNSELICVILCFKYG